MPYSNSIGVTPASLKSIANYLANDDHKHHQDYELTPIRLIGAKSVQEFIASATEMFLKNFRKKSAGRPPKNAGNWYVVRTPDGSYIEPYEMAAYESAACDVAGMGGPLVGILNWHKNKYTGAADMNLLAAAFSSSGRLVRDRECHHIKALRQRMDQVTDALNVLRIGLGISPIVTMQKIKRDRAQRRGEIDIVEELARLPKPPRKIDDLEPALLSLECSMPRFNPSRDSISITPKGKKKAKRFTISKLLAEVAEMVDSLREKPMPERSQLPTGIPSKPKSPPQMPEMPHP